jgi:Uma2 family endonuclease
MSPMPRPEHQAMATNLAAEFRAALKVSGCACKVYQPLDYKIAEDTVLNPDLLIVCKPILKAFLDFAPELVVEILSPATALKDRYTNFDIYQEQRIRFYLIIYADKREVEIYRLSDTGVYERMVLEIMKPFHFDFPECRFDMLFENIWS